MVYNMMEPEETPTEHSPLQDIALDSVDKTVVTPSETRVEEEPVGGTTEAKPWPATSSSWGWGGWSSVMNSVSESVSALQNEVSALSVSDAEKGGDTHVENRASNSGAELPKQTASVFSSLFSSVGEAARDFAETAAALGSVMKEDAKDQISTTRTALAESETVKMLGEKGHAAIGHARRGLAEVSKNVEEVVVVGVAGMVESMESNVIEGADADAKPEPGTGTGDALSAGGDMKIESVSVNLEEGKEASSKTSDSKQAMKVVVESANPSSPKANRERTQCGTPKEELSFEFMFNMCNGRVAEETLSSGSKDCARRVQLVLSKMRPQESMSMEESLKKISDIFRGTSEPAPVVVAFPDHVLDSVRDELERTRKECEREAGMLLESVTAAEADGKKGVDLLNVATLSLSKLQKALVRNIANFMVTATEQIRCVGEDWLSQAASENGKDSAALADAAVQLSHYVGNEANEIAGAYALSSQKLAAKCFKSLPFVKDVQVKSETQALIQKTTEALHMCKVDSQEKTLLISGMLCQYVRCIHVMKPVKDEHEE